ncbi:peptidoglycan bridge formation glycyltransferase FemA/FemB family protein [Oceanobacillus sp. APA_J-2(6-2)]|nr:peptidoglycan bridge formation glycyltransferase FemA/FemB family protein [Oceanobacillus alkalisoli]
MNDIYGSFKDEENMPQADVHCYFQQSDYLVEANKPLTLHKKSKTLCIDLHKSEDQLRKEMNRTTRYQINKAGRDDLRVRYLTAPSEKDVEEFASFFNPFAAAKGIELCRNDKVAALKKNGNLVISYVHHQDNRILASHLYIIDGNRATMLYSCSGRFVEEDIPPLHIGRANRYLHWNDILFFKQAGYQVYDFLGLSINEKNEEEQNINKFKKGFGGREETNYQSFVPQTRKGMLMLFLLRFKWRNQLELVRRSEALVGKQEHILHKKHT